MHCQWCGGKLGRDCYSPFECEAITRDMYERGQQEQQAYDEACELHERTRWAVLEYQRCEP
jgi:hypothetical protein